MDTKTKTEDVVRDIMESTPDDSVRVTRRMEVGTVDRQGDIYIHRMADDHARGQETGQRQVAVGSTVGARHVACGPLRVYEGRNLPEYVQPYEDVGESAYLGPVVVADEPWVMEHPEHANHQLPAGTYQITYQVDPIEARRVID